MGDHKVLDHKISVSTNNHEAVCSFEFVVGLR